MIALNSLPPLSLYVHIPWCVKKCPYCDFNSHNLKSSLPEKAYIEALLEDLTEQIPLVWGRQLSSIFIGGGTPSLFSAQAIDQLLSGIRALIPIMPDAEITLEANPGTAEASKFEGFLQAGVNRLSIGIQSFNARHLKVLGRIHNDLEAKNAIVMAQRAGFKKINLDLMHGLPEQTETEAKEDLLRAIDFGIEHISWYQLTLEPNTLFYQQPPRLPDDDRLSDIQDVGEEILTTHGFSKYEVSAFSKRRETQSQHNLNYWTFGDYLGIGAGAHGKITLPAENQIVRMSKKRNPKDFLNPEKSFLESQKKIETEELPLEFMMNAMRLVDGVPEMFFFQRTGLSLPMIAQPIKVAQDKGLLERSENWLRPSDLGHRFLNDLLDCFSEEHLGWSQTIPVKNLKV